MKIVLSLRYHLIAAQELLWNYRKSLLLLQVHFNIRAPKCLSPDQRWTLPTQWSCSPASFAFLAKAKTEKGWQMLLPIVSMVTKKLFLHQFWSHRWILETRALPFTGCFQYIWVILVIKKISIPIPKIFQNLYFESILILMGIINIEWISLSFFSSQYMGTIYELVSVGNTYWAKENILGTGVMEKKMIMIRI